MSTRIRRRLSFMLSGVFLMGVCGPASAKTTCTREERLEQKLQAAQGAVDAAVREFQTEQRKRWDAFVKDWNDAFAKLQKDSPSWKRQSDWLSVDYEDALDEFQDEEKEHFRIFKAECRQDLASELVLLSRHGRGEESRQRYHESEEQFFAWFAHHRALMLKMAPQTGESFGTYSDRMNSAYCNFITSNTKAYFAFLCESDRSYWNTLKTWDSSYWVAIAKWNTQYWQAIGETDRAYWWYLQYQQACTQVQVARS